MDKDIWDQFEPSEMPKGPEGMKVPMAKDLPYKEPVGPKKEGKATNYGYCGTQGKH